MLSENEDIRDTGYVFHVWLQAADSYVVFFFAKQYITVVWDPNEAI